MYLNLLSLCPVYTHLTIRFQYETLFYLNNNTPLQRHLNAGILGRHLSQRCQFEQNDYSNLTDVHSVQRERAAFMRWRSWLK
jgi:hypothetical protein